MATETDQRFLGKVALVTGSNSGIGEAIALRLAQLGASVTLCGRDVERLEESLSKCIQASGGHAERFLTAPGDVTDPSYRLDVVQKTVDKFGRLDVLVCNAGAVSVEGSIHKATEENFDTYIDVFLKSVFFIIQKALPHLEKSKGNIVNVSSMAAKLPESPAGAYSLSKAALDHMTRSLALDLAPKGIRVNSINPSAVMTRIIRVTGTEEGNKLAMDAFCAMELEKQPMGNRLVTLEELAESTVFLASDRASFITGQTLAVDGGRALVGPFVH